MAGYAEFKGNNKRLIIETLVDTVLIQKDISVEMFTLKQGGGISNVI